MGEEIPVKELSELLDTVSEKVPKLIKELMSSFYSEESGKQMGRAVAAMYKELVDSGVPAEEALKMAKDYLNTARDVIPRNFG
ncbi:MAG TPA: hypothetical protein GXZ20_06115 [Halanaerobiaceae bacterium]|jgi:hypothetical protein|nr:hypothetical protein [Bacillota bacterium]HHU92695.1 hypothetical protein [Halanaerobiaceae bacterium]HOA41042.1 hypothetical protein [Halanaerobiales bacterium]HPZ63205.1 hypothetical protein [Halanaerobiales bacterium]HQD04263.1 hypothetical protein [Halanaerobiales bacterium]